MTLLVLVSLIWAFSFGLIGTTLQTLNPDTVTLVRLLLATAIFAPFAKRLPTAAACGFAAIGAVQFGAMYTAYNWAFQFLKGHEVALLTVTTPFFVVALNDLDQRRVSPLNALVALAAVLGAGIVIAHETRSRLPMTGIVLTQVSNLAFAYGQLAYRKHFKAVCQRLPITDAGIFFYSYAGAMLLALPLAVRSLATTLDQVSSKQALALLYLGVVASGLSFFLWNRGARTTRAGTLAVMNNLKIPLAVAVSLLVFKEPTDLTRLLIGGSIVLAAASASHIVSRRAARHD